MRILLIEDDAALAEATATGLRRASHAVDVAINGDDGLEKASINTYDVVLLDRDLPGTHGDDVCAQLVDNESASRILMLTASGDVHDRVDGLRLGADDYLPKPFAMDELLARIDALGRRGGRAQSASLSYAGVTVDRSRVEVSRGQRTLALTRKEFAVLDALVSAQGAVVSAEQLLEHGWDENTDPFTNAVRITMMTLRRKLGEPAVVDTVTGVGYRMVEVTE